MKRRVRAITQVSLTVLLALSLGFVTAGPSMAQESPEQSASIDPEKAKYDLDAPEDFVSTKITGGTIEAITDDKGRLNEGWENQYKVEVDTLLILPDYLKDKFENNGDKLELAIKFYGVDEPASFTIEAFETIPTANPAAYDLLDPADVEITINWHTFHEVLSIVDDDGNVLEERGPGRHYSVSDDTLTILKSYLGDKLTVVGNNLTLTIKFDGGAIDFKIKAVGEAPSIDPERADYDLDNPANATTTITWGDAIEVVSIKGNNNALTPDDYIVGQTINDEKAMLTILNDYLSEELDIGQSVELSIEFGFNSTIYGDLEHYATFNITAIGTYPTISPVVAPYDLRSDAAVNTTITWRDAESVTSIVDDGNHTLIRDTHYTLGDTIEGETTLTILNSYLVGNLTAAGDSLALTIEFDFGHPAHFTITAVNEDPRIDPQQADYDLDKRGDVATKITWQSPIQVDSVTENGNPLIMGDHYKVEDIAEGEAMLTVLSDSYLNRRLRDVGEAVLTIEFSVGDPVTFNITAVRYSRIDPDDDDEPYNWDDPPDFLKASITWGTTTGIHNITDSKGYNLTRDENPDYKVLGSTLLILDEYLRDKLSDLEPVTLTIGFSDGTSADLIITVSGNHPTISPPFAPYARHEPHDATTIIEWGSATKVEFIVDDEGELEENYDYSVTPIDDKTDTLTIFHDSYLEDKFLQSRSDVKLTIEFDVGSNRTFVITTGGCFIATAAYGTPVAEQIQTLREFRDEYLVTNSLGQGLVEIYYSISPSIADFISEHPGLKPIVRAGLVPAVAISTTAVNTSPAEKAAIVGSLVLASVVLAVWSARRRSRRPICTWG
jgi:hypothetical protein